MSERKAIERQTITVQETAAYLGISKDLVYAMAKAGELPAVKIGRRILFRKESLDRWMQAQEM
ncbi:helix-turn-helix domain-containing protein [Peribacillus frigoritolerans]|uniref:helix-turn-helix domain-containing protein n=1 Tax=Peribacillus TaxID=2675229 RepID=UPI003656AF8F